MLPRGGSRQGQALFVAWSWVVSVNFKRGAGIRVWYRLPIDEHFPDAVICPQAVGQLDALPVESEVQLGAWLAGSLQAGILVAAQDLGRNRLGLPIASELDERRVNRNNPLSGVGGR